MKWTNTKPSKPGWYWRRSALESERQRETDRVVLVVKGYGLYLPGTQTPEEFWEVWDITTCGGFPPMGSRIYEGSEWSDEPISPPVETEA